MQPPKEPDPPTVGGHDPRLSRSGQGVPPKGSRPRQPACSTEEQSKKFRLMEWGPSCIGYFAADVGYGLISAAPSHGKRGCFTSQSCHADCSLSMQLQATSGCAQRNVERFCRRATGKLLSRLCGDGAAENYAEQNGGENGEWQKCIRWRAVEPTKLLVQQFLIAPSHRGQSSNRGCSPHCAGSHI